MRRSCSWLLLAPLLAAAPALAQTIPPEVVANASQWPLPNKDYASTRFASSSSIHSGTVNDLQVDWSFVFPVGGFFGAVATNPLILDGVVYFQDLDSNVYALDIQDGSVIWSVTHSAANFGPDGVAVGYGRVFLPKNPKTVAALDKNTGVELWAVDHTRTASEGMTIQPLVYDEKLYLSTVPGTGIFDFYSGNASGRIHALSIADGASLWNFDTVDTMHEIVPHIWINTSINSGGGAWYPPTVDTVRNTTYWAIGNPAPFPGTPAFPSGTSRLGDNLYTNSLLALDHATGNLDWHNQAKAHDLVDADFMISPILVSTEIAGQPRDLVIGSGKLGKVIAYDRDTGVVEWTRSVGLHQNDELDPLPPGDTVVLPGVLGGVETPMAYADGKVFVPVVNLATTFNPTQSVINFPDPNTGTGELVALNVTDGSVAWQVAYPAINLGAATVVGDLVFTATFDGTIFAHAVADGTEVWSFDAGAPINSWPAVAGNTILFSTRTRMLAFRLDAAIPALPVWGLALLFALPLAAVGLRLATHRRARSDRA